MIVHPLVERLNWRWADFRGSDSALKWNRRDLPALDELMQMAPRRRVAVQAGGNLGIFAKYLARTFDAVYTFEPAPALFPLLVHNAPEPNIVRFQAALGCQREGVRMAQVRRDNKPDAHEGITHVAGPGMIPTLRLDDLALPVCDLLALDLEGWELYALQGAVETIRRTRPVISCEINKSLGFVGLQPDQVYEVLRRLDYRFVAKRESDEFWLPTERAS